MTTPKLHLCFIVVLLALMAVPKTARVSPSAAYQDFTEQEPLAADDSLALETLATSTAIVTGLFELQSDPVVAHLDAVRPAEEKGLRVELSAPEAELHERSLIAEQTGFEAAAAAVAPGLLVTARLHTLVNAVAITAPGFEIARIAALPSVRQFHLSRRYHALLDSSVPLINAPVLWNKIGGAASAGRGIKIAILDSGIDISSPLFADPGFVAPAGFPRGRAAFTNNKVIVARAFLQDAGALPVDQNGHGTNVAGIAAADLNTVTPLGPVSGVAPGAFLGNYRVLDSKGLGDEALIATALEAAFADGFDIANLSFGAVASSTPGMLDAAVEVAVAGGMIVTAAAGDGGASKPMSIESPGTALNAITVGASSNAHVVGRSLSVTGPGQVPLVLQGIPSTLGAACGALQSFPSGALVLFDESLLDGKKRGCKLGKLPAHSLAGKIALIQRGICPLSDKISNAAAAGASAVVIYNQSLAETPDGGDLLLDIGPTGAAIPSVFIGRSNGIALKSWVDANPGATLTISGPAQFSQAPDVLASFSSAGPTIQGTLKPDLTAPGVDIYSGAITACNQDGISDPSGFLSVSGTSQATAHVAGAVALIKQFRPNWTVAQIKSALVNSAKSGVLESPVGTAVAGILNAGAGRVDLSAASNVSATLAPATLSFGVKKLNKLKHALNLQQTLNVTSVAAGTTNFTLTVDRPPASGVTVTLSTQALSLTQGQTAQVQVTIAAKKMAKRGDFTGFITITSGSPQSVRAPFWVRL